MTVGRPTIVILPEWKAAPEEGQGGPREKGLRLFTVRRLGAGAWLLLCEAAMATAVGDEPLRQGVRSHLPAQTAATSP